MHNIGVKLMQHFMISVLHSSHSAGLWERRRDFDTRLWQTVRLGPDSHINGLQLHWLRHQQLHPAGCGAQGLSHYQWQNTLSTDKLANKEAFTVGIDVWLPRCKLVAEYPSFFFNINIFSAQLHYYTSWLCVGCWVSVLDPVMFCGRRQCIKWRHVWVFLCFKLQRSIWSSPRVSSYTWRPPVETLFLQEAQLRWHRW